MIILASFFTFILATTFCLTLTKKIKRPSVFFFPGTESNRVESFTGWRITGLTSANETRVFFSRKTFSNELEILRFFTKLSKQRESTSKFDDQL